MTKELKALEHIYYGSQGYGETDKYYKYLKEFLEAIDNAKPNEALECFKDIEERCKNDYEDCIVGYDYEKELSTIKQVLIKAQEQEKVLKIILKKNVWVARLKRLFKKYNNDLDVLRIYNANMPSIDYQLTQEEFDLLKRWLYNEQIN